MQDNNPSPETQTAVEELLSWVVDEPVPYTKEFPQTLYVEGRTVKLPRVVGSLTYGQNVMVKQALDGAKYYEEILVLATAIYIQQAFDESEKFIPSRARELALVLERYPAQLIYPKAFLSCLYFAALSASLLLVNFASSSLPDSIGLVAANFAPSQYP